MKQFENKVLFIKDEETRESVISVCKEKDWILGNFVFQLNFPFYLYKTPKAKRFNGVKQKFDTDQEITLQQFKELLKQK